MPRRVVPDAACLYVRRKPGIRSESEFRGRKSSLLDVWCYGRSNLPTIRPGRKRLQHVCRSNISTIAGHASR